MAQFVVSQDGTSESSSRHKLVSYLIGIVGAMEDDTDKIKDALKLMEAGRYPIVINGAYINISIDAE